MSFCKSQFPHKSVKLFFILEIKALLGELEQQCFGRNPAVDEPQPNVNLNQKSTCEGSSLERGAVATIMRRLTLGIWGGTGVPRS